MRGGDQDEYKLFLKCYFFGSFVTCHEMATAWEGLSLKGQERKEKDISTARQENHDLTSRFCRCRCSTLFNFNRYSCAGAFFDLIDWLKDYFLDLYLYVIF